MNVPENPHKKQPLAIAEFAALVASLRDQQRALWQQPPLEDTARRRCLAQISLFERQLDTDLKLRSDRDREPLVRLTEDMRTLHKRWIAAKDKPNRWMIERDAKSVERAIDKVLERIDQEQKEGQQTLFGAD